MVADAFDFLEAGSLEDREVHRLAAQNAGRLIGGLMKGGLNVTFSHDLAALAVLYRERGWHLSRHADPVLCANACTPERTIIASAYRGDRFVGASVQRLIWIEGTFKDACESLRFFFNGQLGLAPKGMRCTVTAPIASEIRNCDIVYSCAFHLEPEETSTPAATQLVRLAHALAAIRWRWAYLIARVKKSVAHVYAEKVYGFPSKESGIWVGQESSDPKGDVTREEEQYLIFTPRDFFLQQLTGAVYGDAQASLADHQPFGPGPDAS